MRKPVGRPERIGQNGRLRLDVLNGAVQKKARADCRSLADANVYARVEVSQ